MPEMDYETCDAWLCAELDESSRVAFEAGMDREPQLQRELLDQMALHGALSALFGDGTADRQVVQSVLRHLDSNTTGRFKATVLQTLSKNTLPPTNGRPYSAPAHAARLVAGRPAAVWQNRMWLAFAAMLVIGAAVFVFRHRTSPPSAENSAGERIVAQLAQAGPDVTLIRGGTTLPLHAGSEIRVRDELRVPASSAATIAYPDGTRLEIGHGPGAAERQDTTLVFEAHAQIAARAPDAEGKKIYLSGGAVDADVAPQPLGKPMLFITPHGEARVLGTELQLAVGREATRLAVTKGKVRLTNLDGKFVNVRAGNFSVAAAGAKLAIQSLAAPAPVSAETPAEIAKAPVADEVEPLFAEDFQSDLDRWKLIDTTAERVQLERNGRKFWAMRLDTRESKNKQGWAAAMLPELAGQNLEECNYKLEFDFFVETEDLSDRAGSIGGGLNYSRAKEQPAQHPQSAQAVAPSGQALGILPDNRWYTYSIEIHASHDEHGNTIASMRSRLFDGVRSHPAKSVAQLIACELKPEIFVHVLDSRVNIAHVRLTPLAAPPVGGKR